MCPQILNPTLSWEVENCDGTCEVQIVSSSGQVFKDLNSWSGSRPPLQVTVSSNTTFTLSAKFPTKPEASSTVRITTVTGYSKINFRNNTSDRHLIHLWIHDWSTTAWTAKGTLQKRQPNTFAQTRRMVLSGERLMIHHILILLLPRLNCHQGIL